ncbi:MAG: ribosome biogenesis GTPase Der [Bacillota bacterium]
MSDNLVAIVGRPNVGKSTLFNRLIASRTAIEEKVPGVTRDRLYGVTEWRDRNLVVVDTGGITFGKQDPLTTRVQHQINLAIEEARVIIFLLDGREGLTALDEDICNMLRRSGKPVLPVVNKLDSYEAETNRFIFYSLGFGEPLSISAEHGRGTGDLLDAILGHLPDNLGEDSHLEDAVKVAVIGRPNVGKSSLINFMLGKERVVVNHTPGTTRDAVDTYFNYKGQPYVLIDTAGMRRKSKVKDSIEYYSVLRSLKAVQRADLALLLIDAEAGITEQDQKLAGYVNEIGKGLILTVNKWDLFKGGGRAHGQVPEKNMQDFINDLHRYFNFVDYAPSVFVSAKTGWRLDKLFPLIMKTWQEQHKRVPTALLNELLEDALSVNPPPTVKGKQVRIYYTTQPSIKPPTFVFFANAPELIHFSYKRYLENRLREAFDFSGTPLVIKFKKRQRRGE